MDRVSRIIINKILIVAFLCCLAVPVSVALFVSGNSVKNVFTVGENNSHIEEAFGSYDSFEKGKSYEKRMAVKNDGSVPCYVRVFAEMEDPDVAAVISVDFNSDGWTEKQSDGYYYYKNVLPAGELTEPLFTTLKVSDDVSDFKMICYSETVQAAGSRDFIAAFAEM